MARGRAKPKVEVEDDELEELEDLEDLEDEADSTSDEDEEEDTDDEDDDEEEDEAPRRKSKSKGRAKAKAKSKSGGIGTHDLAEALGTDGKNLRVMLRDRKVKKNENGRYEWESVDDALEQLDFDDLEDAQAALKQARDKRLDALKEQNATKKKSKPKRAAVEEDEDDEDEDDEGEEEEAPAPRRSSRKTRGTRKKR